MLANSLCELFSSLILWSSAPSFIVDFIGCATPFVKLSPVRYRTVTLLATWPALALKSPGLRRLFITRKREKKWNSFSRNVSSNNILSLPKIPHSRKLHMTNNIGSFFIFFLERMLARNIV